MTFEEFQKKVLGLLWALENVTEDELICRNDRENRRYIAKAKGYYIIARHSGGNATVRYNGMNHQYQWAL